ncbi:hypothetical protein [Pricia antarctica]|nr:hypothetical protein [Pricia antarctica]
MQPKRFLKILATIHLALCVGLVLCAVFAFYQNGDFTARMNQQDIFIYIVPIVAAAGYFLSQLVFKKRIESISRKENLSIKLRKHQITSLIKYALLEGPGFLALTAYFWSGNALYLIIAIALIVYLFVQRPTAEKIKKELPLTLEEQKQFDNLK